ncbi:hypothetical protein CBR_g54147 [Chara braunii]|uniref:Uncharacterized protein n=1 Tax=Chara braunii TaxID=69332 RepID=A0A388MBT1_CHABU|nr:hypothetical protein CBR_g54147 [Chara braunii]|eukprot:GBG92027.1 hypothetical protein CBR_g54147 [Chara braunii]
MVGPVSEFQSPALISAEFSNPSPASSSKLALIAVEEQRQLAAKAAQLQADEAAAAEKLRLQAEADADTQACRKEAQDMLQRHEATSIDRLKFWHFQPNGDNPTPEEKYKEFLSKLVTRLLYACNYQRSELERQYQDLTQQHQELATLRRTVQSHEDATWALNARLLDLEQAVPGPTAGASSSALSSRQLEERVDRIMAMLGDINTFAAPSTISTQLHTLKTEVQHLQSTNADGNQKMPTFQLEKFDDYTQQDPTLWWEAFTTQLRILPVAKHKYIGALFLNSKGGCQTWLTHLATSHGVNVPDLKDKITWEELTRLWKKRFIVDDAPALAINRLFAMSQGNTATRDWLTEWQKIAAVPNLNLPFEHLGREFYNRSCAALSQALGDRKQYSTFAEIIDKAREIIKTNRSAAHEKSTSWQPTYVEKDVSRKLLPKWFGPWSVTAAAGDEPDGPSFVIDIPEHLTVHPVFHASMLATYTPAKSEDFPGRRSQDPPSMDGHQEVDRVISDRKYGSKPRQYKVTFKACDRDDTRWISGADLKASAPLIYAHFERQRLAKGPPRPAPPTRTVVPPSERQLRPRR